MNKKIEIYYPDDSVVNVSAHSGKYLKDDYARHFSSEMLELALNKDLSGNDLRAFLAILANLDFDNKVNISQQKLADQINVDRSSMARSIKKLVDKGYLQIVDTVGSQNIYMFNPNVAFKSRANNLKILKQAWDKKVLPNTLHPIDIDTDLEPDLGDKLDDKVEQLSEQFKVPKSKVRQIILSLVNQALEPDDDSAELPY